ncbi:MAG TPA: alkaline phosphatase family protein, partial [Solirubrobacteraceae bacterium]
TYLMYRGRHRHEPQRDTTLTRIASTLMRHAVMGPRELFYADVFASRQTGCRSNLGMPGVRDRHSGCVGAYLVEHDLFDFMLLSLPDNDWRSHRSGPDGQLRSIALADIQLARVMNAAGGLTRFLEEHAVIVMADHSQAPVSAKISLQEHLDGYRVLPPGPSGSRGAREGQRPSLAVCPSQRAAMVYVLEEDQRERISPELAQRALEVDGVELAMWMRLDAHGDEQEAVVAGREGGELRFCPGGDIEDLRGRTWSVEGDLSVLGGRAADGRFQTPTHPDALDRAWSALTCPNSGDVLLSAAPGSEFVDLGGQAHVGGGSHGSLRAEDSLGALIVCGCEPERLPQQWAIRDVAALVSGHFGIALG